MQGKFLDNKICNGNYRCDGAVSVELLNEAKADFPKIVDAKKYISLRELDAATMEKYLEIRKWFRKWFGEA